MTDDFVFTSPYLPLDADTLWLKGNHHGHSILSDGIDTPEDSIAAYEAAGYDYFALSEHDRFCDPATYQGRTRMLLLPAVEVTSDIDQTLMYLGAGADLPAKGALTLEGVIAFVAARGGLFICDHPNWLYRPGRLHAPVERLLKIDHMPAIEIYTGVIERLSGEATSLDVWDRLLTARKRVYGHATDDQHAQIDRFLGWNMVQWPVGAALSAAGVIGALGAGRFVASTGVVVDSIGVLKDHKTISIASNARKLRWIVAGGVVAEVTEGGSGALSVDEIPALARPAWLGFSDPGAAIYVRVECVGEAGSRAWSQPFFIKRRTDSSDSVSRSAPS
jgi:hypothetical protein